MLQPMIREFGISRWLACDDLVFLFYEFWPYLASSKAILNEFINFYSRWNYQEILCMTILSILGYEGLI